MHENGYLKQWAIVGGCVNSDRFPRDIATVESGHVDNFYSQCRRKRDPPASPDGEGVRLPDYYLSSSGAQQQVAAARDAVFSALGE